MLQIGDSAVLWMILSLILLAVCVYVVYHITLFVRKRLKGQL